MSEAAIRLIISLCLLLIFGLIEWLRPQRSPVATRRRRWPVNLGLALINAVTLRITLGAIAVSAALFVQSHGFGLFNQFQLPFWLEAILVIMVLDAAIYGQHRLTHRIDWLWRLHAVHHADLDLDVTSGYRFHPVEILLSALWKAAVVIALGADALAVVIFEVVLNGSALFTHANIRIGDRADHWLRRVVCTPDMHRVHHSTRHRECNSNYGFFLSLWDRNFASYQAEPPMDGGHRQAKLGLAECQEPDRLTLRSMLLYPLRRGGQAPGD